jgi:hypothetical protein
LIIIIIGTVSLGRQFLFGEETSNLGLSVRGGGLRRLRTFLKKGSKNSKNF